MKKTQTRMRLFKNFRLLYQLLIIKNERTFGHHAF